MAPIRSARCMTAARVLVVALLWTVLLGAPALANDLSDCIAHAPTPAVSVMCYRTYGSTGSGGTAGSGGSADLATYQYSWLPACPGATPVGPQAAEMACSAMLDCPDSAEIRLNLWQRQTADSTGQAVDGSWTVVATECRSPDDVGEVRRSLTWQDVETAIRRVGIPAARVSAPGFTLVNLETTFYTDPQPLDRTLQIIGYDVDVQIAPAAYTWHWGDGQTTTTDTPGRPYPADDVTHTYLRHTPPHHPAGLSVDVRWHARYRVDDGAWTDIPDTITIAGPATALPIRQASAVLVEGHTR